MRAEVATTSGNQKADEVVQMICATTAAKPCTAALPAVNTTMAMLVDLVQLTV